MADEAKISIVTVDDNEAHCYLVSKLLARAGYEVEQAHTGTETLAKVGPQTHLVVLDVHLPDANGFDICRKLRANPATSRIPVLFLSSTTSVREGKRTAAEVGAQGFLSHPLEPADLLNAVKQVLEKSALQ